MPERVDAFAEFLQAKFALDQRSLNPSVWRRFLAELAGINPLDLLDVGAGTGSMMRRILQVRNDGAIRLIGIDIDAGLLAIAASDIAAMLIAEGFAIEREAQSLCAVRNGNRIEFHCVCSALSDFRSAPDRFDVITAHAIMDLVPLRQALSAFWTWLQPGGLLYSTINYDGETVLFPPYPDHVFEDELLQTYDASMERRRLDGEETGGAHCGRRLYRHMLDTGFDIVCYGNSDWNITPQDGAYRDEDSAVLDRLLDWIRAEGNNNAAINPVKLNHWFACRRQQLQNKTLGIIIHQLDILARKAG